MCTCCITPSYYCWCIRMCCYRWTCSTWSTTSSCRSIIYRIRCTTRTTITSSISVYIPCDCYSTITLTTLCIISRRTTYCLTYSIYTTCTCIVCSCSCTPSYHCWCIRMCCYCRTCHCTCSISIPYSTYLRTIISLVSIDIKCHCHIFLKYCIHCRITSWSNIRKCTRGCTTSIPSYELPSSFAC